MSASNFIRIRRASTGYFLVEDVDYESGLMNLHIGEAPSSLEALEMAEDYMCDPDNEVEYGIRYSKG